MSWLQRRVSRVNFNYLEGVRMKTYFGMTEVGWLWLGVLMFWAAVGVAVAG